MYLATPRNIQPWEEVVTFEELCRGCTEDEKRALAWHLAELRYRNTLRALLPKGEIVNPHVLPYQAERKSFPTDASK